MKAMSWLPRLALSFVVLGTFVPIALAEVRLDINERSLNGLPIESVLLSREVRTNPKEYPEDNNTLALTVAAVLKPSLGEAEIKRWRGRPRISGLSYPNDGLEVTLEWGYSSMTGAESWFLYSQLHLYPPAFGGVSGVPPLDKARTWRDLVTYLGTPAGWKIEEPGQCSAGFKRGEKRGELTIHTTGDAIAAFREKCQEWLKSDQPIVVLRYRWSSSQYEFRFGTISLEELSITPIRDYEYWYEAHSAPSTP